MVGNSSSIELKLPFIFGTSSTPDTEGRTPFTPNQDFKITTVNVNCLKFAITVRQEKRISAKGSVLQTKRVPRWP